MASHFQSLHGGGDRVSDRLLLQDEVGLLLDRGTKDASEHVILTRESDGTTGFHTLTETRSAISAQKLGKAPGPVKFLLNYLNLNLDTLLKFYF